MIMKYNIQLVFFEVLNPKTTPRKQITYKLFKNIHYFLTKIKSEALSNFKL
jgi:hypothetical protein